jgi:hypothetical protein
LDELERAAIRGEGYDPDDPKVIATLDRVRAELAGHPFAYQYANRGPADWRLPTQLMG